MAAEVARAGSDGYSAMLLAVAQVALSVGLLSAAGLFVRNLSNLEHADVGFRRDHVLLVSLDPSRSGYSGQQLSYAYEELLDRLPSIPGVRSVTMSAPTPLSGAGASRFVAVEGHPERPEDRRYVSIELGRAEVLRNVRYAIARRPRLHV